MTCFVGRATPKKGCPTLKERCPTPRFHIQLGRARIWNLGPRDSHRSCEAAYRPISSCTTPAASQSGFRIYFGSRMSVVVVAAVTPPSGRGGLVPAWHDLRTRCWGWLGSNSRSEPTKSPRTGNTLRILKRYEPTRSQRKLEN